MRNAPSVLLACLAIMALPSRVVAGTYEEVMIAVRQNRTDDVVDLVRRGVDPNTSDRAGTTLLMLAAANGNEQLLDFLLRSNASALKYNEYNETAMAAGSLNGHLIIVRRLAEAGAPIDGPGWNALHYAAFNGHAEIVRYLLTKGANPNALAPNQQTSLMLAAKNGHKEVAKMLVDAGANRGLTDPGGDTALAIALKAGNLEIADYLRGPDATK
jgi:ankyrin repeat protein